MHFLFELKELQMKLFKKISGVSFYIKIKKKMKNENF